MLAIIVVLLIDLFWERTASIQGAEKLNISRVVRIGSGPYVEVLLQDTKKGRSVNCALYYEGKLMQTDTTITRVLATKMLIYYPGDFDQVRCVFND